MAHARHRRELDRETALEQTSELQRLANAGRLVAALSHDMRNALAAAKSNLEYALEMTEKGRSDPAGIVESLREGMEGLARAIGFASTLFRLVSADGKAGGRVIDVGGLMRQALLTVGPVLLGRPIELDLPPSCFAAGEQEGLLQAVVHLLLEARERGGGEPLRLRASKGKREVRITVSGARRREGVKQALLRALVRASGGRLRTGRQEIRLPLQPH